MSSDAKVGLLLGLVCIFLVAFIINGLPSFRNSRNNNDLTATMIEPRNNPPGFGAKERKVRRQFSEETQLVQDADPAAEVIPEQIVNDGIRFEIELPKSISMKKELIPVKSVVQRKSLKTDRSNSPRLYTVQEGDCLADVAKKVYGNSLGNKEINVRKIFEANRKLLRSADEIHIGQKLKIPRLKTTSTDKDSESKTFSAAIFEKIKSISNRNISDSGGQADNKKRYVVQDNDSLWRIAAKQLGNGSRYGEIARMNANVLGDEDRLTVGMRLRIPVR